MPSLLSWAMASSRASRRTWKSVVRGQGTQCVSAQADAVDRVATYLQTFSSALTKARKLRLITHNPCVDVGKLNERRERRQAKPLTYDEEAGVKRFSPPWLSILITVLAETGLRVRKEALPLKWSDVDVESEPGCIRVRDSKTAAGVRPVWLTKHCRNTLIQWKEFLGPGFSEYVFPSPRVPSTHITDYKKAWQKAAREAGIPDRRIYDLRASFASRANACHASGLTIAQLLGHANSTQILPTYVKPLDENTKAVIKAVIEALDAARASRPSNCLLCNRSRQRRNADNVRPLSFLKWVNLNKKTCLP